MKKKADKGLLIIILALFVLGLMILFSASGIISLENMGSPYYYFIHQLLYGGIVGLIAFLFCQKVDYRGWKKFSLLIFFACLALSVLVFVPGLGFKHGGAQRWLAVGPVTFQPSELLKLGFIIYLAAFLSKKQTFNTLIPFLVIIGLIGGLMAVQSDAGTLALIAIIGIIMYFVSGAKIYQIAVVLLVYLAGFFALVKFFPHRMARFTAFLNPGVDPQGISYQINQALIAIGSGGLFGVGLGNSYQRYNYLPEPMGDSIFAIWAEQLGFLGAIIVVVLFLLLAFKGLRVAKRCKDDFGSLLAIGITSWLVIQFFINIGGIMGLMPLTGIPLPFISYGGSALIVTMAGAGILLNISKHT
ncbi:MAG: putative lipid II flippase FtsW [Candidatus Portnoybacteria bacterium]|nr:putative lipid II flippase FtsW [Candidatus Portnoybacteria bacterium]